ncbi:MAG: ABC transporter permease subunit [Acutalibacteraceae bacterium]|nr:ABC transporter permease subunit [Acutalibacteraceae bacterium]
MIKQENKLIKQIVVVLLVATTILLTFASCKNEVQAVAIRGEEDLKNASIGVQLGTTGDLYASDYEKDGATVVKYNKGTDAVQALKKGKVDCVVIDEQPAKAFVKKNADLSILDKPLTEEEYAICVAKENTELLAQVNEILAELKSEGTLDKIIGNYIGDDTKGTFQYTSPQGTNRSNGTLVVATNAAFEPYEYVENGKVVGIDIDISQAIADGLGMELKIEEMEFDSIISAVSTGKAQLGVSGMTVTEERLKNINFTTPYTTAKQVIIVRGAQAKSVNGEEDLKSASIGVQLGTTGDLYASDYEDDGATVVKYNKGTDAVQALKKGKVDCVVIDEQPAKAFVSKNSDLSILENPLTEEEYAICIAKENTELLAQVNDILAKLKNDGTLDKIIGNYIGDDTKGTFQYTSPQGTNRSNGTLVVATNAAFEPYEYVQNGKVVGIDIDISQAIADGLGMELKIEEMEFDSIISAVSTGKAQLGVSGMTVTEERLKNINFTTPYTTAKQVIIVRDHSAVPTSTEGSFIAEFIEKFNSDFVEENRWQYIAKGLVTTLQISFFSALIGIVLGFLIAVARVSCDKTGKFTLLNLLLRGYLTIIRGTPAMIQLLIIYYVIFATSAVDKVFVAVIAFGLNSSAYIAEIVRSGIMSIDEGQFEAGRSLGFSYSQTMTNFILPQAIKNVLPALGNEFIVLIKETSISGYIGIMDLTRGGDLIRSRTYDAFLPLIAVALVYLVIVVVLTSLLGKLEKRLKNDGK